MELKDIVAKNLTDLRKISKLTQAELAEKLNYSDKAVSKWERGESLPDVETIKRISELYGVSVDCLLRENADIKKNIKRNGLTGGQKLLITIISSLLVWVIATAIYVFLNWGGINNDKLYLCFIYAIPATVIVVLVFNSLWGKVWFNMILVSALLWTVALCAYLVINVTPAYLCFIIALPIQIAFFFWYGLRILNIRLKKKKTESAPVEKAKNDAPKDRESI